jgi:hypothetical protein
LSWGVEIFQEREGSEDEEINERPGGPLTIGGRGQAWVAPPGGEVAWWVPLRSPRCLSAPFLTKKFKKIFLKKFEKLYF